MTPAKRARAVADAERVMNALRRLVRALRSSTVAVERGSGISGAQLFVLRALVDSPGQSLRELVAHTLTSQSTVSEVVAKLVAAGLVARRTAEQDGRRAVLSATAKGRALSRSSPPPVQVDLVAGLGVLPPGMRRTLAEGLEQWLRAAGLEAVPPTMFFEPKQRPRPARAG
jgi:DNA-binding MarR family transcriptional regulator